MSAAQSENRLDSRIQGSSRLGWSVGLAIASLLLVPAVSYAQMQALPPPPSTPGSFPPPDTNLAPFPSMAQPMPALPASPAPAAYPVGGQGATGYYGGAYQVIVYGASPYLLRQIKFLEPNASMQMYQGRQVIVAGTFDNPAAAQQRVLALSDYGVGAQAISTNMGGSGQQMAGMSFPMSNGMAAPTGNPINSSAIAPTADTPPNLFPNAAPTALGTVPVAPAPPGMPTSVFPGASVTAPMAVTPPGMPANAFPEASINSSIKPLPPLEPTNSLPNAPMDESVVAPPPGMPMNAPMGSPPLGAATVTPPTTAIPGNANLAARYEVVIPARREDFNAIANRLMSMGVSPAAIQGREKPRGPHVVVGPYAQVREAEAMSKLLQSNGMDARVFYVR